MDAFDKICCVMDAQGFVKGKKFYPRELSILSDTHKQTILCDTHLDRVDLTEKDRKTNNFLSNNILGMAMSPQDLDIKEATEDNAELMIVMLYDKVKTRRREVVAIKNYQLAEILDDWGIPYVDLSRYHCPNFYRLKRLYGGNTCHFHERAVPDRSKLRCAEQKCENMWKWIIDYKKINS